MCVQDSCFKTCCKRGVIGEWGIIGGGEQSLAIKQDFMFGVNPVFEFNSIIFIFVPFLACLSLGVKIYKLIIGIANAFEPILQPSRERRVLNTD